jgi:hypothetical protein
MAGAFSTVAARRALSLGERLRAQVLQASEHLIEDEEDQIVGLAVRDRRLQRGEVGGAGMVERADLAIDDPVRQPGPGPDNGREFGPTNRDLCA